MKVRAKKRLLLAAGLLTLLLGVGAAAALSAYNRLSDALNEMTQPSTPTRELGVYVLADDPAQALEDAAGYTFGGLEDGEASLTLLGQALVSVSRADDGTQLFQLTVNWQEVTPHGG